MTERVFRRFIDIVGLLNRGAFAERCDAHLADAIATLDQLPEEKGKATITVTLDLVFEGGRIDVRPAVKSKLPETRAFSPTAFWSHEGAMSVQHPSQFDMFARAAVPPGKKEESA